MPRNLFGFKECTEYLMMHKLCNFAQRNTDKSISSRQAEIIYRIVNIFFFFFIFNFTFYALENQIMQCIFVEQKNENERRKKIELKANWRPSITSIIATLRQRTTTKPTQLRIVINQFYLVHLKPHQQQQKGDAEKKKKNFLCFNSTELCVTLHASHYSYSTAASKIVYFVAFLLHRWFWYRHWHKRPHKMDFHHD